LALFRRNQSLPVPLQLPESRAETFRSLGLKALFELLATDRKYRILDLGLAIGANIEFLLHFSSKLRVENLFETLSSGKFFGLNEELVDESLVSRILSIPEEERFDVVLSWDLVNYFKPVELRALIGYLETFCAKGALFFTMGSTAKEIPAAPTRFKLIDAETLLYTAGSAEVRPCPRYAPRDLSLLMSGFRIQSSYILQNGMQEYVFVHD
jgi:hypothetical protein